MYAALGPLLRNSFGLNEADVLLVRLAGLPGMALASIAGTLAGRLGAVRVAIGGLGLAATGLIVQGLADDTLLVLVVVASVVFVAGIATTAPAVINLVTARAGHARASAIGLYALALFAGASVGPLIAELPFRFSTLVFVLATGLILGAALIALSTRTPSSRTPDVDRSVVSDKSRRESRARSTETKAELTSDQTSHSPRASAYTRTGTDARSLHYHSKGEKHTVSKQYTATEQTSRDTVNSFFTHFEEGNLPALIDLFSETVDFHVFGAPNVPWAGFRSTKTEIGEFFPLFGKHLGPPEEFVISSTLIDGEDAVVIGRNVFEVVSTGKKFTNNFAIHFTITDGKIARYHMHEDSYAISAAFPS